MKGGGWDKKVDSRSSMASQRSSLRCPWFQCAERSFETEHEPPASDVSDFSVLRLAQYD